MALFGISFVVFIGVFITAVTTIIKAIVSGKFTNSGNSDAGFDLHQQAHRQATDMQTQMHHQAVDMHNQAHTIANNTFFHM